MPDSVREAKKRETRRALSSAAIRLATDRGLHGFTVEEVASEAGVSPRTFFNYFRTKEAAIIGLDEDELVAVCAELEARPDDEGPVDALAATLIPHGAALTEEADAFVLRNQLLERYPELLPHRMAVQHQTEAALTAALARRLGASPLDPYPAVVTAATFGALRAATEWHQRVQPPQPLSASLYDAAELVARGLGVRS